MDNRTRGKLWDIQRSISRVFDKTAGKDLSDYQQDADLPDIVERNLIIITEAMMQAKDFDEDTISRISQYQDIIGLRIILVHGYHRVDNETIWEIITENLPDLQQEVTYLLDENRLQY